MQALSESGQEDVFYLLNSGLRFSKKAVMPHLVFNPAPDQVDPANFKAAFLMI